MFGVWFRKRERNREREKKRERMGGEKRKEWDGKKKTGKL